MLREVGGETVLLNLESETYFGLDDVGTEILRNLRAGKTIDATVDSLLEQFDVERDVLHRDVVDLVEELVQSGLVSWS